MKPIAVGARQPYIQAPKKKKKGGSPDGIPFDTWENFLKGIPGLIDAALQATTAEGLNAVIVKIVATAWLQRDGIGENATCELLMSHMGRSRIIGVCQIPGRLRQLEAEVTATFRAKRRLMRFTLQLNKHELIYQANPLIHVIRQRCDTKGQGRKFILDETNIEKVTLRFGDDVAGDKQGCVEVGGADWLVIDRDQSCIIQNGQGEIEFIALRNAIGMEELVNFIDSNAHDAANNFRGLRPTEPGSITAFGLSAGPRHHRMFGYAKNLLYPSRFTQTKLTEFHRDLLGCSSLVWMVAESRLPTSVVEKLKTDLDESGLPGIYTSQIPEGSGFHLKINNKDYNFPEAPRGPPEVYWSKNYASKTHKEQVFAEYAVSYTARRIEVTDPDGELPPFGGDFVDIGLKVMMRQASDTMFVFHADELHGTSPMHQVQQTGVVYPFSTRLVDAYEKAKKAETVFLDDVVSAGDAPMVEETI